uniref:Transcription factor n=1 Tax=Globodera pallida TaxID=36090 RepID=A0A183CKV4_GLOPA
MHAGQGTPCFASQQQILPSLQALQQQLIGQETHIHSQETHIHSQDTRIRRQDTRIRRQEQRLGIQEQRLGMQEQRLGMQEQRLGMQQMWITELRSRIVQLERAENEQQRTSASSHRTTPTGAAQSLEPFVPFEYQPQQQSQENASATVQQAIVQTGQSFGSSVPFQGVAPSSAGTSAQFFTPQQPPQHPPPHGMNPHYHPYHRSGPPIAKFSAQKNIGSTSEQFAPLNITTQAHEHFHRGQWTPAPNAPIEDGRGGLANNAAGFKF